MPRVSRYLRILRRRAALVPFAAAVLARLPISMAPLGMVLLIQQVRGNYTIAGSVTAAFALATSVSAPMLGRLLDRVGQARVLVPTALISATLLAALALVAASGGPYLVLLLLSAAVGLSFPVITPAMRAAWRTVLESPTDRAAAYAMDAVAVEAIFVGGPLLLSALLALRPATIPLLVTAAFLACGGVAYSLTAAARNSTPDQPPEGTDPADGSPLRTRGVPAVLVVSLAMSVGFGQLDVSLAATARQVLHDQARVGLLFAAIAGGSSIGGLWYGARAWSRPERQRLPIAMAGFGAGLFAMPLVLSAGGGIPVLLPVLFGTGLCIAPGLIIQQALIDRLSASHRLGEAQSWLNTGFTAGGAGGTALGGILVDLGGPGLSFTGAALAVTAATVVSFAVQRRWR